MTTPIKQEPNKTARSGRTQALVFLASIGLTVVLVALLALLFVTYKNSEKEKKESLGNQSTKTTSKKVSYSTPLKQLRTQLDNNVSEEQIIDSYGRYYDDSSERIMITSPSKWSSNDVDSAYLCILYADKVSNFSQVQTIYYQLISAQDSGIDISKNSAGIAMTELNAIKSRADQQQEASDATGGIQ